MKKTKVLVGLASCGIAAGAYKVYDKLKALQERLQAGCVRVERGDGVGLLRRQSPGSMQLVFIDPPFESTLFEPALKAAADAIAPQGLVYLEAPRSWTAERDTAMWHSLQAALDELAG